MLATVTVQNFIAGLAQHGIDVYSAYYNGRCLQCKLHKKDISDAKLINELQEDLRKAKQKFNDLKQFIFAISVETRPAIQDACKKLSDDKIQVIPWFWNQLQEDIARSKWLLRYCLNYETGAQWISDDFVEQEQKKGDIEGWQPLQYFSSNMNVQWYGLLQSWDAPRQHYADIRQAVADSFTDTYSDMPVAAVVRGEGGSGKSVLLRRLALDLRKEYTVYWIADNAADFLQNEWLYDIDNNPTEKYLLVLEDWYRNFAGTGDRTIANRLLQKIKLKSNVRLLIGDRPAQSTYYPKTDSIIFDLQSEENVTLLLYIVNVVPDWKDKFAEEQKMQLLKLGLFQLLFVYQYADTSKPQPKAENYFLEIIQSDYKQLINDELPFYKGLARAIYVFANLYTDLGFHLSIEALTVLAETYSDTQMPFGLKHDIRTIVDDPVVKKYIGIDIKSSVRVGEFYRLRFLHDTLADLGWKYVSVDNRNTFDSPASMVQLFEIFKTEKTAYDLSTLLYLELKSKRGLLTKTQILSYCDYLISIGNDSQSYARAIFTEGLIEMGDKERLDFLQRLIGLGNRNNGFWGVITTWIKRQLKKKDGINILQRLVEAGNDCSSVRVEYFKLLSETELREKANDFLTLDKLTDPFYKDQISIFMKRLAHDDEIHAIARKYLESPEPEKIFGNFTTCLNLLKEEKVAKDAARNYLKSPEPEKIFGNFTTCLNLLKEEKVAKDAACNYLKSPEPEKTFENFTTCLNLLNEEEVAKDAARKYLDSPEPEKIHQNFTTCLNLLNEEEVAKDVARKYLDSHEPEKIKENFNVCLRVLGVDAVDIAARILESPIEGQNPGSIYHALHIATETKQLDIVAEDMVQRILAAKSKYFNKTMQKQYYLYLQMIKVPLFRLKPWQAEVDRILENKHKIHRNLFYSLTLSHIDKPELLTSTCLLCVRNWKQEFRRQKGHWGYFIRSLAHPIIVEQPDLNEEVRQLCRQMLLANSCPSELKAWLQSITEENKFPLWKEAEEDYL